MTKLHIDTFQNLVFINWHLLIKENVLLSSLLLLRDKKGKEAG